MASSNREIKTVFSIDGEQTYSQAIRDINTNQKELNNAMKSAQTEFRRTGDEVAFNESKSKILTQQIENQNQKLAEAKNALEQANQKYGEGSAQVAKYEGDIIAAEAGLQRYESQLKEVNEALMVQQSELPKTASQIEALDKRQEELNQEMKLAEANYKLSGDQAQYARDKSRILTEQVEVQTQKVEETKRALEEANRIYGEGDDRVEEYAKAVDEANLELIQMQAELKQANIELTEHKKALGATATEWKESGEKMQDVGKKLSLGVTAPLMGVAAAATVAWGEIEDALDGIKTNTGAVGEEMEGFEKVFRKAYGSLPAEAQKVGDAVGELNTQFDLHGDALVEATQLAVKFAEINGSDVTSSIQGAKGVISQMRLEASDLGMVLDAVTNASQNTGAGVDQLFSLMQKSGPQMREMGLDVGEVAMILGRMQQAGLESTKVIAGLQYAQRIAAKDGKDLSAALDEFTSVVNSSASETDKLNKATELFGSRNGVLMLDAAKQGILNFNELGEAVGDAGGIVERTFEEILDPIDNTKIALNNLKLAGGDLFTQIQIMGTPALESLAEKTRDLAEWFGNLDPEMQQMIVKLAAAAAAAGPATMAIGKLSSGIGSAVEMAGKLSLSIGEQGFTGALSSAIGPAGKIMLAVAALALLAVAAKQVYDAFQPGTEEIRKFLDEADKADKKYADNVRGLNDMSGAARDIVSELAALEKQTSLTTDEQLRMQLLVDQLNQIYPELNLQYDAQAKALSMTTLEIGKQIEKIKEQIALEVHRERWKQLMEEELEIAKELSEKQDQLANSTITSSDALGEQYTALEKMMDGTKLTQAEYQKLEEDIEKLTARQKENTDAQVEAQDAYQATITALDSYAVVLEDSAEQEKKTAEIRIEYADEVPDRLLAAYAEEKRIRAENADDIEAYHAAVKSSQQSHINSIQGFADKEFDIRTATAAELMEHQRKMLEAYRDYEANMAILSKKVPEDVLTELRKLGPDGAHLVAEYVSMTDAELEPYVAMWSDYTGTALDAAKEELNTMPGAAAQAALDTVDETIKELKKAPRQSRDAMRDTVDQYTDAGTGLVDAGRTKGREAADAVKDELDKAPSQTRQAGKEAGDSYKAGLSSTKSGVANEAAAIKNAVINNSKGSLYNEGANFMDTFAAGIKARAHVVSSAAAGAAALVPKQTRNVLQIHSPSRLAQELSHQYMDGHIIGFEDKADEMIRTGEDIADDMVDSMRLQPEDFELRSRIATSRGIGATAEVASGSVTTNNNENVVINLTMPGSASQEDARKAGRLVYQGWQLEKMARGGH